MQLQSLSSSHIFILLFLITFVLCAEDYYKLLGLDRDAEDRQIKKAYRTLSKKYHPDKNPGDQKAEETFVAIAEAYDVLSDSELRKIYNQYGHEGIKQHRNGGGPARQHDPFDLFSRFFGGTGHFGHNGQQRQQRGPNKEGAIAVMLRDFYNGAEHDITVEKQVVCSACEGSGSKDGQVDVCQHCGGQGIQVSKHQLAPGIFQQVQHRCNGCGGKGKTIRHLCPVCNGERVIREKESYKLVIERGLPKGMRVTFENEADEHPDWVPGDLIIEVNEADPTFGGQSEDILHQTDGTYFRRKGKDLFWREVLSLREAWMGGWQRNITHLDGHVVHLGRERGQVIQPGTIETISNEGMPIWYEDKATEEFGNLLIEYFVVLPDQMEKGMEKEFWAIWEKHRTKKGLNIAKELYGKDEL